MVTASPAPRAAPTELASADRRVEPLALQAQPSAWIRPAHALSGDVAAVLREGRVLAGQVLERFGGGSILVAIGSHRVPAEAQVELEPGQRFLFRVEREGADLLLRLLGSGVAEEAGLLRALRATVGQGRPLGELLHLLAASLRAEIAHGGAAEPRLRELAQRLEAHVLKPGGGGQDLMALLSRAGQGYEAALLRAALRGARGADLALLLSDLKAELLSAHAELPEGPARQAVARALGGLEAEQLLNLARREGGEAQHLSIPLPDGDRIATAHLLVRREIERDRAEEDGEGETGEERELHRVTLGVDFTHTGPVRVDLWLRADSLSARFLVEREELASRLTARFADLEARLASNGLSVRLAASVATPAELDVEARARDVAYLREHPLLDVNG